MGDALFADISGWQPAQIGWSDYVAWSRVGDGIARIVFKASEGVGAKDKNFETYWTGALEAGIGMIGVYHYARPDLHQGTAGAQAQARWFASVVGKRLRGNDRLMLDLEQNESSDWAKAFGQELNQTLPTANKPVLYDSLSHIKEFLQDPELPGLFDLAVADWTFNPDVRPSVPAPWKDMVWVQYSDKQQVPGIGAVDANIWLGGKTMVPPNWRDDGTYLHNPVNSFLVFGGFRQYILTASSWSEGNIPLENAEDLGSGKAEQVFRYTILQFDPVYGTQEGWIGDALLALRAQVAQLQGTGGSSSSQQLAALQAKVTAFDASYQSWLAGAPKPI